MSRSRQEKGSMNRKNDRVRSGLTGGREERGDKVLAVFCQGVPRLSCLVSHVEAG